MADRRPGIRCPACGGFLADLEVGRVTVVCHGYQLTVERTPRNADVPIRAIRSVVQSD